MINPSDLKNRNPVEYCFLSQKQIEDKYKEAVKKLKNLDNKFNKIKNSKNPNQVDLNIIKSRGKRLLEDIDIFEKELKIEDKDKIKYQRKYFID